MSIYLIRHGQTNGNRDRIIQTPDIALSELGLKQAEQLALSFKKISIGQIICSDYVRAQQTADPLCAIKKISMNLQPLLRERSFGDLRGKAYDEIDADFFDNSYAPPNGETQQQFAQRVELAWQAVLTSYQHTEHSLIVMTHGLVLRQLIKQHLVVNRDVLPLSDFQNTCIIQVQAKDKKTVLRLCDVQHLDENSTIGTAI